MKQEELDLKLQRERILKMKQNILEIYPPRRESKLKGEKTHNGDELVEMICDHVLNKKGFARLNHLIDQNESIFRWSPVPLCSEEEQNFQGERVRGNVHAIVDYLNQSGYKAVPLVEPSICDECGCVQGFMYGILVRRR